jgi:homoserine kinase type II
VLTASDIERLIHAYDVGTLLHITRAIHGYVNETALIETDSGRFVVRRNHRRFTIAALRRRHALIAWLRERDFPAPALIPARSGATLVELDNRCYEIQEYVEGGDYDPDDPRQLAGIGATLARYHRAVQGFPIPSEESAFRYNPQTILVRTEQLLERDVLGELHEMLRWYDLHAARLRSAMSERVYVTLPHCLIHGDVHSDNFRFADGDVAALLDYDQVCWDARIVDLADALIAFATAPSDEMIWGVYSGPLDEEHAAQLVHAYNRVSPLAHAEVAMLPLVIEALWMQGELGRVISTPEGAPEYHMSVLDQGRVLVEWIERRREELVGRWFTQAKMR